MSFPRSFIGYSGVNAVLSEVRDPVRTIKLAAPLVVLCVTVVYLFINVSYFAVVSKTDMLESQWIVALVIAQDCLINIFVRLFWLQSFIFPQPIWSYDRKSEFLLHTESSLVDTVTRHRPLSASSCYLRWGMYYLASFPLVKVTKSITRVIPLPLIFTWDQTTVIQELGREGILPFSSLQAIVPSMRH